MSISDLGGRDVAILGAGREGLAAWRRLRSLFPDQPVTLYNEQPLAPAVESSLGTADALRIGPFEGDLLVRHDVLIRSPGVSPYRKSLREALAAGVEVTTGTNLWLAEHSTARTLCVTGTKGKSTTASLLHHLLTAAGERAAVAGNIGVPLIECDPGDADWWVLELSSYQICDLRARPWLALLLNLSDEHLDWHGSAERYRDDKLRLAELAPEGRLVANAGDPSLQAGLAQRSDTHWYNVPGGLRVERERLFDGDIGLPGLPGAPGAHNLENLAAALAVTDLLDLRPEPLEPVLAEFRGLAHRQHSIGVVDGLEFIDDGLSTTPVATLAALNALAGRRVTVLVGGFDRGIDWASRAPDLEAAGAHAFVGLPDSGAGIIDLLSREGLTPPGGLHAVEGMQEAVSLARRITPEGGVVLLSPGAPSFPIYRDYRDRASAFATAAGLPSSGT